MKKISKSFQRGTASLCITTRVRIRHVMIPLVLSRRIPVEQAVQGEYMYNTVY